MVVPPCGPKGTQTLHGTPGPVWDGVRRAKAGEEQHYVSTAHLGAVQCGQAASHGATPSLWPE